jgi:hypothetical protein
VIAGFVDGNAVDPGFEAGLTAECTDAPEDLEKDLLNDVAGIGRIAHQAVDKAIDRILKTLDERFIGLLITAAETIEKELIDWRKSRYSASEVPLRSAGIQIEADGRVCH